MPGNVVQRRLRIVGPRRNIPLFFSGETEISSGPMGQPFTVADRRMPARQDDGPPIREGVLRDSEVRKIAEWVRGTREGVDPFLPGVIGVEFAPGDLARADRERSHARRA